MGDKICPLGKLQPKNPRHTVQNSPEIQALLTLKKLESFPDIDKPEKVSQFLDSPIEKNIKKRSVTIQMELFQKQN